jgi:hypothetical protein
MNRIFDYNGSIVAPSNPVKQLKSVKRSLVIDSTDRDIKKFPTNNDVTVYLPRVYENVVSIRLMGAELPASPLVLTTAAAVPATSLYYLIDIEGLNKTDECSPGADRSGFPDGHFAKIPIYNGTTSPVFYSDNSAQSNIANYSPPIGKLDRMRIRFRLHSHKSTGNSIYWNASGAEWCLTFEIETLENSFDEFSSFETRVVDRIK